MTARQERLAGTRSWAGYRSAHYAHSTGALVAVLHSDEAGIESDPEIPWATLCDDHASVVCHHALADARAFASVPELWCNRCADRRAERLAELEQPA